MSEFPVFVVSVISSFWFQVELTIGGQKTIVPQPVEISVKTLNKITYTIYSYIQ